MSAQANNHALDTDFVTQRIIRPAVDNLRVAASRDPNLALWLDLLRLDTTVAQQHTGPNAYATLNNGMPVVYVDMEFILNCFHISDFAGLLMSRAPAAAMTQAGQDYGKALVVAVKSGAHLPPLGADLDNLPLSGGYHVSAKQMSHLAFGAAMQFIILHEIAHHQLKHFDREPKDLAESRQWELDADSWAIEEMQFLGFGLDPLAAVFESLMAQEMIRQQAGLALPAEQSTHPSWQQRYSNLKNFDIRKPSDFGNWINIVVVSSDAATNRFYANELLVPRKPMPGVMGQFRQFGKLVQMPVEHRPDGSIRVFGRNALERSEITISNLDSLYPDIRFRHISTLNGQESTSQTRGYQADMAFLHSSPVKGFASFTVKDVMQMDPVSVFESFLRQVENRPDKIDRAIGLQRQMLAEQNRIMLSYARGQIGMSAAQQQAQKNAQLKSNQMRILLGNQVFGQLKQTMLSSSFTADAYQQLLGN